MLFLHFFLAPFGERIDSSSPLGHLFFLPLEKMCEFTFASSSLFLHLERRWERICHPIIFTLCFGEKMGANLSSCSPLAGAPYPHLHQQSFTLCADGSRHLLAALPLFYALLCVPTGVGTSWLRCHPLCADGSRHLPAALAL